MADVNVNAHADQAPTMAPLTRTDDQILPHIKWVPIGKRGSGKNSPNPSIPLLKIKKSGTSYSHEEESYSYCDPEYPVHQADHLSLTEEAQEYLAKVAEHQRYLAGETGSDADYPAPKSTKTTKKSKPTAPKADPRPPVSKPASSQQPSF
nr:hypothetical protein [Tanacetum cinerariifolium]